MVSPIGRPTSKALKYQPIPIGTMTAIVLSMPLKKEKLLKKEMIPKYIFFEYIRHKNTKVSRRKISQPRKLH
ncbi:hypothetical protein CCAND38_160004 [Capnocytophaga canis]|uniref:Uncharacterized protein n=1 Tax=Capnocytophaga canis TaxID=1848903 RepID=A0A0B7HXQ9_9FLAO|nr:hypothetical protein CCAND38_160004 [Capnocytophaga canis]